MGPLIFLNGVVFASAAAITLGLLITLFLVILLGDEYPRLAAEGRPLMASATLFAVMTAASAASFLGHIRRTNWRWPAQAASWLMLVVAILYYWPD